MMRAVRRRLAVLVLALLACRPDPVVSPRTKQPKTVQELVVTTANEIGRFGFPVDLSKFLMETREPAGMNEVADGYVAMVRRSVSHETFAQLRRALEVPPLTNGAGMREGIVQMIAASTLVGFLHDRDTLVFRTDAVELGGPLEHALARALVLAYIDHNMGGLAASVLDASATTEVALIRQCLTEGFATYVADTIHASKRNHDQAIPTDVPAALLGTHANVPCAPGVAYVAALHAKGGWQSVLAAFGQPPTSSEQLLHPSKLDKDFPVNVDLPPWPDKVGDAEQVQDDIVGELGIERVLRERGYDDVVASRAAIGWDGDRLGMWRQPNGEYVLVWRSVWDREQDAEQFAGTIAPFTTNEPRGFRIVRRGRMVDAVSAQSDEIAQAWYITLQDSLDQLAIEPADATSTSEVEAEPAPRSR